jgi:molecular chaperone DnaJ
MIDEIKKACLKMAIKYHLDKNPGGRSAQEKSEQVSEAYDVLNDEQRQAAYDRYDHDAFDPKAGGVQSGNRGGGRFQDPFDIFREDFNSNGNICGD